MSSDTSGWNSGAGFVPLGSEANTFTGSFDGLGHTISALTINRPATSNVGLFGYTDSAVVKNIGLVGGSISGKDKVGGLVGYVDGGTITNGYWNTTANSGGEGFNNDGTGLSADDMQKEDSFTGFDFDTVWTIYDGHSTPLLRSFLTPLTVTYSGAQELTYSGNPFAITATYSVEGADASGHLFGLGYDVAVNVGSYSANLWSDQQGYIITTAGSSELTITPADPTLSGSRTFDGSTLVSGDVLTVTGVNNEIFSVTGNGDTCNLSTANVQADSVLASVNGLGLGSSANGGLATNYMVLNVAGSKVSITNPVDHRITGIAKQTMPSGYSTVNAGASSSQLNTPLSVVAVDPEDDEDGPNSSSTTTTVRD
jgi:hypothetical protein